MVFKLAKSLCVSTLLMVSPGLFAKVITIKNVDQHAKLYQSDKPMITMVTAKWCGPCKSTKPHYEKLSDEYTDVSFCLVDI